MDINNLRKITLEAQQKELEEEKTIKDNEVKKEKALMDFKNKIKKHIKANLNPESNLINLLNEEAEAAAEKGYDRVNIPWKDLIEEGLFENDLNHPLYSKYFRENTDFEEEFFGGAVAFELRVSIIDYLNSLGFKIFEKDNEEDGFILTVCWK